MSDLAIILLGLAPFTVPLTVWLVLRAGRAWFQDLLGHVAAAQRVGDPVDVARSKLEIEKARVALEQQAQIAKLEREQRDAEFELQAKRLQLELIKQRGDG